MCCTDGEFMMQRKLTIFSICKGNFLKMLFAWKIKCAFSSLYWAERSWVPKNCKMSSVGCETKYYLHQKILSLASE